MAARSDLDRPDGGPGQHEAGIDNEPIASSKRRNDPVSAPTDARSPEEVDLLREIRDGRPAAWDRVVRRYSPLVLAIARSLRLDESDASDVFQATWVSLYRHSQLIQRPGSLPAWIVTTARREAGRLLRARERRAEIEARRASERTFVEPEASDEIVARLEQVQIVRDAIDALGSPCRDLLAALYLSARESSYREVAGKLGVPVGSVGPTRLRCLAKLARALEGRVDL